MIDVSKLAAASAFAGLQNIGNVIATTAISGAINAGQYSTLTTSVTLDFPTDQVISCIRFQCPGPMVSAGINQYWFPLPGSTVLYEYTYGYFIELYVQSSQSGRQVNINLVNNNVGNNFGSITFTNWMLYVVAELYSYPFA
jgi:hypothetical protein